MGRCEELILRHAVGSARVTRDSNPDICKVTVAPDRSPTGDIFQAQDMLKLVRGVGDPCSFDRRIAMQLMHGCSEDFQRAECILDGDWLAWEHTSGIQPQAASGLVHCPEPLSRGPADSLSWSHGPSPALLPIFRPSVMASGDISDSCSRRNKVVPPRHPHHCLSCGPRRRRTTRAEPTNATQVPPAADQPAEP